jgi:hypothetical protein
MNRTILSALIVFGAGALYVGCLAKEVPLIQNGGDAAAEGGGIGGDGGACGTATCTESQLCCAGSDEYCTPTCMDVSTCPIFGKPCKIPDSGTVTLQWYLTCGAPVCPADAGSATADAGACAPAGTSCTQKGVTCGDPNQNCGVVLVCDDHDPRTGGCPVSSKKYKEDIAYADDTTLQKLHDETLAMRLATYRYKGPFQDPKDPHTQHLGFIVEDQPESLSVDRGHDRVDLYGTMSMAIATMQVQEKEIAGLRKELAELRTSCARAPGASGDTSARPRK